MTTTTISAVRNNLSETLNVVQYQHERVILERHGKPVAVLVPLEDYETLEALEDKQDITAAEEVLANSINEEPLSFEDTMKEIGL